MERKDNPEELFTEQETKLLEGQEFIPRSRLVKSVGIFGSFTLVSRILGLVREQVFAYLFGAGIFTDAFVVAFRIPNLLRDLFGEGVLSSALVPVFSDYLVNRGKEESWKLANVVINSILVILSALIILGIIFSPFLVKLYAAGYQAIPGKIEMTIKLTRIMFPFLLLVSLAAIAMGILNSFQHFGTPALAPTLFNLGMIFSGIFLAPIMPRFGQEPIVAMALGVLLGGLGQMLVQFPTLRKEGFQYQWILNFHHQGLRKMLILMTPAIMGLAATQINIFVDTFCASRLSPGSVSYLNYAIRLVYLPLGIFGVSVATVTLPTISNLVARKEVEQVKAAFSRSWRLVLFLTLPATVALIVLRVPLIALLFQHGLFNIQDTIATSKALVFYIAGLFAYASVRVMAATFYSLGEPRVPVKAGLAAMAVNVIGDFSLMGPFGYQGIAFATSLSGITNMSILFLQLRKRLGNLKGERIFDLVGRVMTASLGMAIVTVVLLAFLNRYFPWSIDFRFRLLQVIAGMIVGGITFATIAFILKIDEIRLIYRLVKSRFPRGVNAGTGR